jgi:hypothetical protein
MPEADYPNVTNGFREVLTNRDEAETWNLFSMFNETSITVSQVDLNNSPVTKYAIYCSLAIAGFVGLFLLFGAVYGINVIYLNIIHKVENVSLYSTMNKSKTEDNDSTPLLEEGENDQKENEKKNSKDPLKSISLAYNPSTLLYQLFVLAPPLSAFIDYLCVLIAKQQYINSVKEFYTHLFKASSEKLSDDELHDLSKEQIVGLHVKTLYEKFCYLNGLLEQKLDDDAAIKELTNRGFKIEQKSDA